MMSGYVLALGALATLPSKLKGGIFDMEQEIKTVTIPMSEFEDIRSKAAQYTALRNTLRKDVEREYKQAMDEICDLYDRYYNRYSESDKKVRELEKEIEKLNEELNKYKSRKWWQFWN